MKEVGDLLRRAREARKLTLEQIHGQTKISVRYLTAIEEGRFEELPGEVYLKGFLRSYAEAVGLSPEAVLEEYKQRKAESEAMKSQEEAEIAESQKKAAPRMQVTRVQLSAVVVALVLIVSGLVSSLLISYFGSSGEHGAGHEAEVAVHEAAEPTAEEGTPEGGGLSPAAATGEEAAHPASPEAGLAPGAGGVSTPTAPAAPTAPATPTAGLRPGQGPGGGAAGLAPAAAPVQVSLKVVEPCWTSVSADGRLVYEGTLGAGETGSWQASRELSLKLGRPGGVQILFNGRPIGSVGKEVVTLLFTPQEWKIVSPRAAANSVSGREE